jgi:hypothetical protein
METITKHKIDIDIDRVCKRLGYQARSPSASILTTVKSQIASAYQLVKPAYLYEIKPIEYAHGDKLSLGESFVFTSKTVSHALSDCEQTGIYVATVGNDIEKEMSRMVDHGQILEATVLDMIGSEAVNQVFCHFRDNIVEMARDRGWQATIKYSPGYCDWHINQQRILFQIVDTTPIGVSLNESCMMIPRKSVSGLIGMGKLDSTKQPPCIAVCDVRAHCTIKRDNWNPEKQWFL